MHRRTACVANVAGIPVGQPVRSSRLVGRARRLVSRASWLLLAGVLLSPVAEPCRGAQTRAAASKKSERAAVKLTIDYGDGVQKTFTRLEWRKDMTVLDAMEAARKHARGIKFRFRGKGRTAFLTQIDDLENEGRGRNWVFRVNGELGESSFGIAKLKAGDAILWKFGKYQEGR